MKGDEMRRVGVGTVSGIRDQTGMLAAYRAAGKSSKATAVEN